MVAFAGISGLLQSKKQGYFCNLNYQQTVYKYRLNGTKFIR